MAPLRALRLCLPFAFMGSGAVLGAPLDQTLVVGGVTRHYLLQVPAAYAPATPVPLVFVFHGKNNTGALMAAGTGFSELAEKKDFIAVFPDGLGKEWNGGRKDPISLDSARSDDIDFVSLMIDDLSRRYKVDPRRVYAVGSSNGAIFCYTLAARLSQRIAAIAPVNGTLGASLQKRFHPGPVSIISFNGTDDTMVPYGGYNDGHSATLSVPDTLSFWVAADGCDASPVMTKFPVSPQDEGTTVMRVNFNPGPSGSEITAYIIAHGGHTWPGHKTDPSWAKTAGKTAMSIDATSLIWEFFAAHPKS